jgi:hypothetical protein
MAENGTFRAFFKDQRLAFLDDRLRRMEQPVIPLLDDDLLPRS